MAQKFVYLNFFFFFKNSQANCMSLRGNPTLCVIDAMHWNSIIHHTWTWLLLCRWWRKINPRIRFTL